MNMKQLEEIKELTDKIQNLIKEELSQTSDRVVDNKRQSATLLQSKLKEFSEALTFEIKNRLFEDYQKEQILKKKQ